MSKFHRQVADFCDIVNLDKVESSISFGGICHALHCLLLLNPESGPCEGLATHPGGVNLQVKFQYDKPELTLMPGLS